MARTAADFVNALVTVPEVCPVVEEHLEDNDGLLLHLLVADLRRCAIQYFEAGQAEVLQRLLAIIDAALGDGTADVRNAIAVSFVEDTGWWDPAMRTFIEAWPQRLQAEVGRQRDHRD